MKLVDDNPVWIHINTFKNNGILQGSLSGITPYFIDISQEIDILGRIKTNSISRETIKKSFIVISTFDFLITFGDGILISSLSHN